MRGRRFFGLWLQNDTHRRNRFSGETFFRAAALVILAGLILMTISGASADVTDDDVMIEILLEDDPAETPDTEETAENPAREAFINDIISLGEELYHKAGGKLQRAHYKGDIYVCKNFTVYLFRQTRDKYRMAEYPDTQLKIPDNMPEKQCKPYYYGYCWKDIPAKDGNPFYEAAQFLYDTNLSAEENRELALAFMRQVKRGDYFQMTAKYSHGTGAHSAIMISDYDPETNTVHWMDSNMAGKKINGIRYGMVQFDAEESIEWWVDAFCMKKRGATLYRLRDDIIFAE